MLNYGNAAGGGNHRGHCADVDGVGTVTASSHNVQNHPLVGQFRDQIGKLQHYCCQGGHLLGCLSTCFQSKNERRSLGLGCLITENLAHCPSSHFPRNWFRGSNAGQDAGPGNAVHANS